MAERAPALPTGTRKALSDGFEPRAARRVVALERGVESGGFRRVEDRMAGMDGHVKFDLHFFDGSPVQTTRPTLAKNWRQLLETGYKPNPDYSRIVTWLCVNGSWTQVDNWTRPKSGISGVEWGNAESES